MKLYIRFFFQPPKLRTIVEGNIDILSIECLSHQSFSPSFSPMGKDKRREKKRGDRVVPL
jgi:hypothetical protein